MPGQTVLEIEAGAGYYTELLSRAVGPTGKVIMQSPDFGRVRQGGPRRAPQRGRLTNVTPVVLDVRQARGGGRIGRCRHLVPGPARTVLHEGLRQARSAIRPKSFAEISRVLKPGGTLVIIDHVAPQGTPTTSGNDLHRIDPMQIKALATAANFALEEESALLDNPADDHTKGVFDPAIQGKTDQFLLRYKKP